MNAASSKTSKTTTEELGSRFAARKDPRKKRLLWISIFLVIISLASYFQPLAPLGTEVGSVSDLGWWIYPHEENRSERERVITSDLKDVIVIPDTGDVWTVGTNGGVYRSLGGEGPFERIPIRLTADDVEKFDMQRRVREPSREGTPVEEAPSAPGEYFLNVDLTCLCAADSLNLWIAGNGGLLVRTQDGGSTWEFLDIGSTADVTSVSFSDQDAGWITTSSALLRSTDSGNSWRPYDLLAPQREGQSFVPKFILPVEVYAKGDGFGVLRSTDSLYAISDESIVELPTPGLGIGSAWPDLFDIESLAHQASFSLPDTILDLKPNSASVDGMNFMARLSDGEYILGLDNYDRLGTIVRTTNDNGKNWTSALLSLFGRCESFARDRDDEVWVVGDGGMVFRSSESRTAWDRKTAELDAPHFPPSLSAAGTGIFLGSDSFFQTYDLGQSWAKRDFNEDYQNDRLLVVAADKAVTISLDKSTGDPSVRIYLAQREDAVPAHLAGEDLVENYLASWFIDENVFFLERDGTTSTFDLPSNSWIPTQSGATTSLIQELDSLGKDLTWLNPCYMTGQGGSWLISDGGDLFKFDEQTDRWGKTLLTNHWPEYGNSSRIVDGQAAGLLEPMGAGSAYMDLISGDVIPGPEPLDFPHLPGISALTESDLWVSLNGHIWQTVDRGQSWTQADFDIPGFQGAVTGIARIDEQRAFVSLAPERLYSTEDGGASWEAVFKHKRSPATWLWILVSGSCAAALLVARSKGPLSEEPSTQLGHILSDKPLEEGDPDSLGFDYTAGHLERFLTNPATKPPLTIGITGAWGSGKSSLMNLVRAKVARNRGFQTVWFNAWHHQDEEQLLAALLQKIKERGVPSLSDPRGLGFRVRLLWKRLRRQYRQLGLWVSVGAATPVIVGLLAPSWGLISTNSSVLAGLVPFLLAIVHNLRAFGVDPTKLVTKATKAATKKELGFRTAFEKEFREVTEALGERRLMILIDDLDRCSPNSVAEVLESINFLSTCGDVFILLGMDEKRVLTCVEKSFEDLSKLGAETPRQFAKNYMEKLVNISVAVPVRGEDQIGGMLGQKAQDGSFKERAVKHRLTVRRDRIQKVSGEVAFIGAAALLLFMGLSFGGFFTFVTNQIAKANAPAPIHTPSPLDFFGANWRDKANAKVPIDTRPPSDPPETELITPSIQSSPDYTLTPNEDFQGEPASPWKSLLTMTLIAGLAVVSWRLRLGMPPPPKDTPEFMLALDKWYGVVHASQPTPRMAKLYVNRARYRAMAPSELDNDSWHPMDQTSIVAFSALECFDDQLLKNDPTWKAFQQGVVGPTDVSRSHEEYKQSAKIKEALKRVVPNQGRLREVLSEVNRTDYLSN